MKISIALVACAILPLALSACANTPETPSGPAQAETYKIDESHSNVLFSIEHANASQFVGRFNDISGSFVIDPANEANCSIDVVVNAASVDTANDARDNEIRSDKFFDAVGHPQITFRSSDFRSTGSGNYHCEGELTLRGQTRPVKANPTYNGRGFFPMDKSTRVGYQATFQINRSDYGMTELLGPLGDEVQLTVNVEGKLQTDE